MSPKPSAKTSKLALFGLVISVLTTLGLGIGARWYLYKNLSEPKFCGGVQKVETGIPLYRCGNEIAWGRERDRNYLYVLTLPASSAVVVVYFALQLRRKP